jgi:hypothetical protein
MNNGQSLLTNISLWMDGCPLFRRNTVHVTTMDHHVYLVYVTKICISMILCMTTCTGIKNLSAFRLLILYFKLQALYRRPYGFVPWQWDATRYGINPVKNGEPPMSSPASSETSSWPSREGEEPRRRWLRRAAWGIVALLGLAAIGTILYFTLNKGDQKSLLFLECFTWCWLNFR